MRETISFKADGEELDIYESRQFNKKYDDNWDLKSYTSELRYNDNDRFFAFIDFEGNEGSIKECPHCLEYGFHNRLGAKILKENERPAPDHDQWSSCYQCGNTFPLYQAHVESEIKDSLETTTNPFESNESIFMSVGKRKRRKNRMKDSEDEDEDIQREFDKGNIVNILYDSSR